MERADGQSVLETVSHFDERGLASDGIMAHVEPRAVINIMRRFDGRCFELEGTCQGGG